MQLTQRPLLDALMPPTLILFLATTLVAGATALPGAHGDLVFQATSDGPSPQEKHDEELLKRLVSSSPQEREAARRALASSLPGPAPREVRLHLARLWAHATDAAISCDVLTLYESLVEREPPGQSLEEAITTLAAKVRSEERVEAAARVAVRAPLEAYALLSARTLLGTYAEDTDPAVRKTCVWGLCWHPRTNGDDTYPEPIRNTLIRGLYDDDLGVRLMSLACLRSEQTDWATRTLLATLDASGALECAEALRQLTVMDVRRVGMTADDLTRTVQRFLDPGQPDQNRWWATIVLGKVADRSDAALDLVVEVAARRDASSVTALILLSGLDLRGKPKALEALLRITMDGGSAKERAHAARALAAQRDPRVESLLVGWMSEGHFAGEREVIAQGIAMYGLALSEAARLRMGRLALAGDETALLTLRATTAAGRHEGIEKADLESLLGKYAKEDAGEVSAARMYMALIRNTEAGQRWTDAELAFVADELSSSYERRHQQSLLATVEAYVEGESRSQADVAKLGAAAREFLCSDGITNVDSEAVARARRIALAPSK